jgi:hypothetical protein
MPHIEKNAYISEHKTQINCLKPRYQSNVQNVFLHSLKALQVPLKDWLTPALVHWPRQVHIVVISWIICLSLSSECGLLKIFALLSKWPKIVLSYRSELIAFLTKIWVLHSYSNYGTQQTNLLIVKENFKSLSSNNTAPLFRALI